MGAFAGDAILAHGSYRALFAVTAGFAALGFVISLPLREPDHAPVSVPSRGLLACATQRDLLPLWFVGVMFGTAIIPMFAFLKTYVMVTHLGSVSSFLVAYSLTAAALRFFLGWLPARFGEKWTLGGAMFCVGAGLLLLAQATSDAEVVIAGVLAGAGHGFVFPIVFGLVIERARAAERAVAVSLVTSLFDAGQLIGGPLFGTIIDGWGHAASFAIAASVAILGFVAFAAWDHAIVPVVSNSSA